jgi:hypothetical protein
MLSITDSTCTFGGKDTKNEDREREKIQGEK